MNSLILLIFVTSITSSYQSLNEWGTSLNQNVVGNQNNESNKIDELLYKKKKIQKNKIKDPNIRIDDANIAPVIGTTKKLPKQSPDLEIPKLDTLGLLPPKIVLPKIEVVDPDIIVTEPYIKITTATVPRVETVTSTTTSTTTAPTTTTQEPPTTKVSTPSLVKPLKVTELELLDQLPPPNVTLVAAPKNKEDKYIVEVVPPSPVAEIEAVDTPRTGTGSSRGSEQSVIPGLTLDQLDKVCQQRASDRSIINQHDLAVWVNRLTRTLSGLSRNIVGSPIVGPTGGASTTAGSKPKDVIINPSMIISDTPITETPNIVEILKEIETLTTKLTPIRTSTTLAPIIEVASSSEASVSSNAVDKVDANKDANSIDTSTDDAETDSNLIDAKKKKKSGPRPLTRLGSALAEAARQFGNLVRGFVAPADDAKVVDAKVVDSNIVDAKVNASDAGVGNDDEGMELETDDEETEDDEEYDYEDDDNKTEEEDEESYEYEYVDDKNETTKSWTPKL